MKDIWIIKCPRCTFKAGNSKFNMSLSDECTCPECGALFLLFTGLDDDEEEESE